MSNISLLHLDGQWLAFEGEYVRRLDSRPRLEQTAIVVTDFDSAVSQVISLEGNPSHAPALIEKRLRSEGLVDSECKILIHQSRTVGNGYQALFTAVPLDRWQQLFAWGESHRDHCLLMPLTGLLWRMLRPGRGLVLHSGRQFIFLANLRNRIVHATALAFSESDDDLAMTVASMATRAARELEASDEILEALTVEWYGSLTRAPRQSGVSAAGVAAPATMRGFDEEPTQRTPLAGDAGKLTYDGQFDAGIDDAAEAAIAAPAAPAPTPAPAAIAESRWTDEALLEIFCTNSGTQGRLGPHTMVRDPDGVLYRTSAPRLVAHASAVAAINPPASRLMYLAERVLPWASAASLALALALAALGGRWTLAANESHRQAAALDDQIAQIEAEIAGLQVEEAVPEPYPAILKFIERATALESALDPAAALHDMRDAAGEDVRILRLRLEHGDATKPDSLRVDGMVKHDVDPELQGMQIARFVERLRAAGYIPVAIDPQMGSARSQSPGGSFSYQLLRADATPAGEAS